MRYASFGGAAYAFEGSAKSDRAVAGSDGHTATGRVAMPHCAGRGRWGIGSGCCIRTADQSQDSPAVARAFRGRGAEEPVGNRARTRTQSVVWSGPHQGGSRCDPAIEAAGPDALELPPHGGQSGPQQVNHQQSLEKPQHQATSHENIQAVARSEVSRKAD